jgi:hypothetical protein
MGILAGILKKNGVAVGYTAPTDEQDAAIEGAVAVVTGGHTIATAKGAVIAQVRNVTTKPTKPAKAPVKFAKEPGKPCTVYTDLAAAARDAAKLPGVTVEKTGIFYWAFGDTKQHAETLKAAGWRWSPHKSAWYIKPADYKRRPKHWEYGKICKQWGRLVIGEDGAAVAA